MHKTDSERALAFAGILQSLKLVQQAGYGKPIDQFALQTSIHSIFKQDAESIEDVYGDVSGLLIGLKLIKYQLATGDNKPDIELSRYLVTLLHLERKLNKRTDLLEKLQQGIKRAQEQSEHFSETHPNVIANLADTYSSTISTLQPRIMVNGDPHRLNDRDTASQIRTLLLAAMRSVVLWRQAGGNRLSLLFSRRRLATAADTWITKLTNNPA